MAVGVGLKETDRLAVLRGFLKSERVCERFLVLESTTKDKPNVNVILSSLGFSVTAADSYRNIISTWVDKDGFFNEAFYVEYNKRLDEIRGSKDIYKIMKQDAAILDSIPVHKSFDLKNTFECISDNMDIKYYLPEGYKVAELDFEKPKLQIVRLVCVSESLPIPFSFMYHYRCGKCDVEIKSLHANSKHECPNC